MIVDSQVAINAPKEDVWRAITDIDGAAERISGLEKVEVLERPESGLVVGFKWRETRTMFGKTATEVMWITDAVENEYYKTRAESHGCVYLSTLAIAEENGRSTLTMTFEGQAQSIVAKVFSCLMGFMMKGAIKKALAKDLQDIKAAVEKQ